MGDTLIAWWSMPLDQLIATLGASKDGLTQEEAVLRLKRFGPNELAKQKRLSLVERFLTKLVHPLILLLISAALISAILGQLSDVVIIIAITIMSVLIDGIQEHQAIEGAEKLRKRVSLTAAVWRDGTLKEMPLLHVVPGDFIALTAGDIVPADGRLVTAKDLCVDQSTLTGESFPQIKNVRDHPDQGAPLGERTNSIFMGATVIAGEGTAIVVATGKNAELGKVAEALVSKRPQTEFEKGITDFGYLLAKTAIFVALAVLISHLALGHDMLSSLLFVLALAIGFAPELLPIIITINLSRGALRMSHRGVIVKSLPSIENFGSMDILCTDKTGTLTENAITLDRFEDIHGAPSSKTLELGFIASALQTGFSGPMEEAILARAKGTVLNAVRVGSIPFDFYRKRLSVIVRRNKKLLLITKGAPEEIMKISRLTDQTKREAVKHFQDLSSQGFRTLGIGVKNVSSNRNKFTPADETDLTYVGLLAFDDPAKKTVTASLHALSERGVTVKILTGDNERVTQKICRDIGLPVKATLLADEIALLNEHDLSQKVESTTIFARMNPTLKERVIASLRKNGHVVGFLGDGINDAPSLRAADIGISVNNAVDVAKETADIILLHKDLHVLGDGVYEGRITYANVNKYLNMGMSSNFGNMVSVALSSLFLPFLPMLPVQILLNDLFYDVSQLLLTNDYVDHDYLTTPHRWNIHAIRQFMLVFGPISSVFDVITFFLLLHFFKAQAQLFQTGWFLESMVTQILIIFSIRTRLVPFFKSRIQPLFAASLLVLTILILVLPISPLGKLFSFVPLPMVFYPMLAGIVVSYGILVELMKRWFYARHAV